MPTTVFLFAWRLPVPSAPVDKALSPGATPSTNLRRSALVLAAAGGLEYGLQILMPIILVRYLTPATFGEYRFLWLIAATALAIAPAFMPQSLFYFLPRARATERRVYIGNVLVYLLFAGSVVAVLANAWNPWLPPFAEKMFKETHGLASVFLGLWIVAALLDVLPTAEGLIRWQSSCTVSLAVFRTVLLTAAAFLSGNTVWLVSAMALVAIVKLALIAHYIVFNHKTLTWQASVMKKQWAYAFPFAIGNALFLLRGQADQWVVASMLAPTVYASFSVATVFFPVVALIRQPVFNAMMPRLNSAHGRGDLAEIRRLIAKSNSATALVLLPIAGGLLVLAPQLVDIVYTSRYRDAVPVMQIYLLGMMTNAFAVGHVLSALHKGRFAAVNSGCTLIMSFVLSIIGIRHWGLSGAAAASVLTLAIGEIWAVTVVARTLQVTAGSLLAWRELIPTVLGTATGLIGTLLLADRLVANVYVLLLIKGMTFILLFAPCFFLAGGRRQIGSLIGSDR
jgi:O-antigen/teichoic acid export membrane protein